MTNDKKRGLDLSSLKKTINNKVFDHETQKELFEAGQNTDEQKNVRLNLLDYLQKFSQLLPKKMVVKIYCLYKYCIATTQDVRLTDKLMAFGALSYFLLPTDVVADFTPVVGLLDDLGVITLAWRSVHNHPYIVENIELFEQEARLLGLIKD